MELWVPADSSRIALFFPNSSEHMVTKQSGWKSNIIYQDFRSSGRGGGRGSQSYFHKGISLTVPLNLPAAQCCQIEWLDVARFTSKVIKKTLNLFECPKTFFAVLLAQFIVICFAFLVNLALKRAKYSDKNTKLATLQQPMRGGVAASIPPRDTLPHVSSLIILIIDFTTMILNTL